MLRFYFEVARTAFRRQLIYRWANLAGLVTNIFWGIIISYVMIALFHARHEVGGFNVSDTLSYVWVVQAMIMIVLPFGWYDLMLTIRSGEVVTDLSKPCDFCWYWFSREIGRDCYYLLFRGMPTYIAGMVLFGFGPAGDWRHWLAYALSLPLGAVLGIACRFLYNIVAFWIVEARAMAVLVATMALFFTGSYIPLPFLPPWLHTIAAWSPFNGLLNVPAEVFLGKLSGGPLLFEITRQIGWIIILVLAVRAITAIAARRVEVQGG